MPTRTRFVLQRANPHSCPDSAITPGFSRLLPEARYRRDCFGELVQIDGCDHEWFEAQTSASGLPSSTVRSDRRSATRLASRTPRRRFGSGSGSETRSRSQLETRHPDPDPDPNGVEPEELRYDATLPEGGACRPRAVRSSCSSQKLRRLGPVRRGRRFARIGSPRRLALDCFNGAVSQVSWRRHRGLRHRGLCGRPGRR